MRPVHEFQENFGAVEPVADSRSDDADDLTDTLALHDSDSTVRNLCLVWQDGRKAFFNYAYLVAVDLTVQNEINTLVLSFGSYTVLLKGYHLRIIFDLLMCHSLKTITASDIRYITSNHEHKFFITEIFVKIE